MKGVFVTANASGAVEGAKMGHVVMVVDVIDMSTTLEAALDAGAFRTFGASPDHSRAPVELDPEEIGYRAGRIAADAGKTIVLITEPRVGTDAQRRNNASRALAGMARAGIEPESIVPNIGAETAKIVEFADKIVLAVTDTGGTAFDAAVKAGAPAVITGTIARTIHKRGFAPARAAAKRAVEAARELNTGITVVAATANSLEDVLAAEYIARLIIEEGFSTLG